MMVSAIVSITRRKEQFFEAFTARKVKGSSGSQTPLSVFVKKLQESLTRMESFEVVTVAQNADGTNECGSLCKIILKSPRRF